MKSYDSTLNNWLNKEKNGVSLLKTVANLMYDKGIELVLFRNHLLEIGISELMSLFSYANKVVNRQVDVKITNEIANAISSIDLPPSKIDIGLLTAQFSEANETNIRSFLENKLSKIMSSNLEFSPKDVVLFGFGRIGRLVARELIKQAGKGQQLRLKGIVVRNISNAFSPICLALSRSQRLFTMSVCSSSLSNGATTVMYEGVPRPSNPGAFWDVIQKHKISIFYTAPTAIRAFMKAGNKIPNQYDLSSLRLLGTVGEPINPEAWIWYRDVIGGGRCPIVDTWWQTETGGVMISPLPGATPTKPGSATFPLPGIEADVVNSDGDSVANNEGGYLVVKRPWPGMMRNVYGDEKRFRESYWEYLKPSDKSYIYFAGDGARRDEEGYFWVMGRVDDVINVSGHRLGTCLLYTSPSPRDS